MDPVHQVIANTPGLPSAVQHHLAAHPTYAPALCKNPELLPEVWDVLWDRRTSLDAVAVSWLLARKLTESQLAQVSASRLSAGNWVLAGERNTFTEHSLAPLVSRRIPATVADHLFKFYFHDSTLHEALHPFYPPIQRLIAVAWGAGSYDDDAMVALMLEASANHHFRSNRDARWAACRVLHLRPQLISTLAHHPNLNVGLAQAIARSRQLTNESDQLALIARDEHWTGHRAPRSQRLELGEVLVRNPYLTSESTDRLRARGYSTFNRPVLAETMPAPYDRLSGDNLAMAISYERATFRRHRHLPASHPEVFLDLAANPNLTRRQAQMLLDSLSDQLEHLDVKAANQARKDLGQRFGIDVRPLRRLTYARPSLFKITRYNWTHIAAGRAPISQAVNAGAATEIGHYVVTELGTDTAAWTFFLSLLDSGNDTASVRQVVDAARRMARTSAMVSA